MVSDILRQQHVVIARIPTNASFRCLRNLPVQKSAGSFPKPISVAGFTGGMAKVASMNENDPSISSSVFSRESNHRNGCLYTVSQAAHILHLPTTWLYERTRREAIPHHKLGKYIRFTDSDLAAIIETCSRGQRKAPKSEESTRID
jgi:excisionase family DNA binding protein